jgi:hypothetical protein
MEPALPGRFHLLSITAGKNPSPKDGNPWILKLKVGDIPLTLDLCSIFTEIPA